MARGREGRGGDGGRQSERKDRETVGWLLWVIVWDSASLGDHSPNPNVIKLPLIVLLLAGTRTHTRLYEREKNIPTLEN